MTTNGLQPMTANEFSGLVLKQKDRRSSLLDITSGQHEVKTTGSGNAKKIALFKGTYTDRKGQQQIYPVVDVDGQAVALSALSGKAAIVTDDGNLTPRPGIVEEGATYDDVLDALKNNGYKFNLTHVVGRVNGFHGRYGVVTKQTAPLSLDFSHPFGWLFFCQVCLAIGKTQPYVLPANVYSRAVCIYCFSVVV